MSLTTVIVGAGMAGITAAYFESRKGRKVILLESDRRAGGLLNSDCNFGHYFDYGTHIFTDTGISELDNFLHGGLTADNCTIHKIIPSGNFFRGVMNSKNGYVDASVLPRRKYNQGCYELLSMPEYFQATNLQDHLIGKFGYTLYNSIFKDVVRKYAGVSAESLAVNAVDPFEITRILAFDDETTKRLTKIDLYNSKLGFHTKGVATHYNYYPKHGGVGHQILKLMQKLDQKDVDFQPSTKITQIREKKGNVYEVVTEGGSIKTDRLIWTLPNSLLIRLSGIKEMQVAPPVFRNTGLFDFVFDKALNTKSLYINVFDTNLLSGRITFYQNMTQSEVYSCTVEVLADHGVSLKSKISLVLDEIVKMGLIDNASLCLYRQYRPVGAGFPILTTDTANRYNRSSKLCNDYFKNIVFLGRTPSAFFLSDVLIDAYHKIINLD